jgi:hypothetical protein
MKHIALIIALLVMLPTAHATITTLSEIAGGDGNELEDQIYGVGATVRMSVIAETNATMNAVIFQIDKPDAGTDSVAGSLPDGIRYNALLDDPNGTNTTGGLLAIFGDTSWGGNRFYSTAFYIRGHDTGWIDRYNFNIDLISGTPHLANFTYDIWMCEADDSSLENSSNLLDNCAAGTTALVADDYAVPWDNVTISVDGIRDTVILDHPYYMDESKNYVLIHDYVGQDDLNLNNASDTWWGRIDGGTISQVLHGRTLEENDGTVTWSQASVWLLDIRMFNNNTFSVDYTDTTASGRYDVEAMATDSDMASSSTNSFFFIDSGIGDPEEDELYEKTGWSDFRDYHIEKYGDWNANTEDDVVDTTTIDNTYFRAAPKVGVLDDGVKYIIAYASGSIVLYQYDGDTQQIMYVDDILIDNGDWRLDSDIYLYDVFGYHHIVYAKKRNYNTGLQICYLRYDGSSWVNTCSRVDLFNLKGKIFTYKYWAGAYSTVKNGGGTILACNEEHDLCAGVYQHNDHNWSVFTMDGANSYVNSTEFDADETFGGGCPNSALALPVNPTLLFEEIDTDPDLDLVWSYTNLCGIGGGNDRYNAKIASWDVDGTTGELSFDWDEIIKTFTSTVPDGSCDDAFGARRTCSKYTTGVMVFNWDKIGGNGKELVIAGMDDTNMNGYRIYVVPADGDPLNVDQGGSSIEQYPHGILGTKSLGDISSHPFAVDCFDDTGIEDVGIVTYDSATNVTQFLCASHEASIEWCKHQITPDPGYNFTQLETYASLVHTFESDQDSDDTDELVTPFGIVDHEAPTSRNPIGDACLTGLFGSDIEVIYDHNERNAFIYPLDYQGVSRADLIFATDTILGYIDDGFTNQNAKIDEYSINPCVTLEGGGLATWQVGTDNTLKVKATDAESDHYQAKAILYADSPYEVDTGWSAFTESGEFVTWTNLDTSQEISFGTLRFMVRDSLHATADSIDITFAVGTGNGTVSFGDCVTLETGIIAQEEDENETIIEETILEEGAVGKAKRELEDTFQITTTLMSFILLLIVTFMMATWSREDGTSIPFIGIILVDFVLMFALSYIGWFPWAWSVIIAVMAAAIGVFWFKNTITPGA